MDTGIVSNGTTKDCADMCINKRFNVIVGSVGFRVYSVCNLFQVVSNNYLAVWCLCSV